MTLLRDESSSWWRCPQTPGIYRIPARMTDSGGRSLDLRSFRPLSRRSGCVPAVKYQTDGLDKQARNRRRVSSAFCTLKAA